MSSVIVEPSGPREARPSGSPWWVRTSTVPSTCSIRRRASGRALAIAARIHARSAGATSDAKRSPAARSAEVMATVPGGVAGASPPCSSHAASITPSRIAEKMTWRMVAGLPSSIHLLDRRLAPRGLAADEAQHALPGILGGGRELLLLAVEERVRRTVVDDDLVLRPRRLQRGAELVDVRLRDALVGAAHQGEDRRVELGRALGRARLAVALPRPPVEADRPGEAELAGRRQPRVPPAEAEADGEEPPAAPRAQVGDHRRDVGLDGRGRRLLDVRPEVEVVVAPGRSG